MSTFIFNNDIALLIKNCIQDTPKTARQIAKELHQDKHVVNQHLYKMDGVSKSDDSVPVWSAVLSVARNQATAKMLYWSIAFHLEGMSSDTPPNWTGADLRQEWMLDIRVHPDDYDRGFYSLVATPAIEATIDWDWIARKLPEYVEANDIGVYHLKQGMMEQLTTDGYIGPMPQ